jgi:hypothetical protein
VSRTGQYLARVSGQDAFVRRRLDVTRLFTTRPGECMTVNEVSEYTKGTVRQVREVLEELAATGWLHSVKDRGHKIVYWREEPGA